MEISQLYDTQCHNQAATLWKYFLGAWGPDNRCVVVVICLGGSNGQHELLTPWNFHLCFGPKVTEADTHVLGEVLARSEYLIPLQALGERPGQGFPV